MEICMKGINWGLTSLREQRRCWAAMPWQQPQTIPQGVWSWKAHHRCPKFGVPNWDKGSQIFVPMLWSVIECRIHPERGCELGWGSFIQLRAFPQKGLSYQWSAAITCGALVPKAGSGCTTGPQDSTPCHPNHLLQNCESIPSGNNSHDIPSSLYLFLGNFLRGQLLRQIRTSAFAAGHRTHLVAMSSLLLNLDSS